LVRFCYGTSLGTAPRSRHIENPAAKNPIPIGVLLPSIGITKRRLKKLDSVVLVREQREKGRQDLAYNARPFVLCGIPLRRPPTNQLTHTRHSGKFFLNIVGHPQYGLPFGQDRLIPIWIATLALRQKTRTVRFQTASEMLDFFKLPPDGYHYRRVVEGFKRIFSATIFFGTEDQPAGDNVIDWSRFHFFDRMKLWFNATERHGPLPAEEHGNLVTLSESFYREIDEHRIPVERHVVAALANAPGVLDFYVWIAWKSWIVNGRPVQIPLTGPSGLSQQLGTSEYSRDRRFRGKLLSWLRQIKTFWPACPATISACRRFLVIQSSKASPAIRSA
jgi:Plasmid encoded RepA protein